MVKSLSEINETLIQVYFSLHFSWTCRAVKIRFSNSVNQEEVIPVKSGEKQSDILAPVLFAILFAIMTPAGFFTKQSWHIRSLSHIRNIHWFGAKKSVALICDLLYANNCDLVTQGIAATYGLFFNPPWWIWTYSLKKAVVMLQSAPGETTHLAIDIYHR